MEIINCCQQVSYKKNYSRVIFTKKISKPKYESFAEPKISFKENYYNLKGKVAIGIKTIEDYKQFLYLIPLMITLVLISVGVVKLMSYHDQYRGKINIDNSISRSLDDIDALMMNYVRTFYFDEEGNIITEEGIPVVQMINCKESVTFQDYYVKNGDTIGGICKKFGLSNISTLIAVNDISNVRVLKVGQKLKIPSMDGLQYTVKSGDSILGICKKFGVSQDDLLDVNDLTTSVLQKGQVLFIPGAKLDSASLQRAMGEVFIKPISVYRLTSYFGPRKDPFTGASSNHKGIDMAAPKGTPVKAAKSGTVVYTGYSNLYGNYVIINHADGYQTLYAHLSKITTTKGSFVSQGTKIGLVGSTGYSTGNHLHFTVYKNGVLVDPLTLIK